MTIKLTTVEKNWTNCNKQTGWSYYWKNKT